MNPLPTPREHAASVAPDSITQPKLGAHVVDGGVLFGTYVTTARECAVRIYDAQGAPLATHPLKPAGQGYFAAYVPGLGAGTLYRFVVNERELPDPYARFLPQGVHGPAEVIASEYAFKNDCVTIPLSEQVIYELHVGTFTPEGTYDAARRELAYLAALGIRTVELMPIGAFAGERGWGYDGVALYAPFAPYGRPDDLKRFIDEAHHFGMSVLLDVVYNHFGPSGNYLGAFSVDYFVNGEQQRLWGDGPNFECEVMRRYVVENATHWLSEYRFDGLRLDAVHAIHDASPRHVLSELRDAITSMGRRALLVAEDERNDPSTLTNLGLHAVWADDFHHQLRVTLTGERDGYYAAYTPGARGIADAINGGWVYQGQLYPPSGKPRGKPALEVLAESLVYCIQNHDQIGNRARGDRLSDSISLDAYCAASMLLLFLPMTPLLFMGQEWAASTPFLYFTDHEQWLAEGITKGRREEFKAFSAFADEQTRASIPDPQAKATFERSRLAWDERARPDHARVLQLYRDLLHLRKSDPVLQHAARRSLRAEAKGDVLMVTRVLDQDVRVLCVNFGEHEVRVADLEVGARELLPVISSSSPRDDGRLPTRGAVLLAGRLP